MRRYMACIVGLKGLAVYNPPPSFDGYSPEGRLRTRDKRKARTILWGSTLLLSY